MNSGAWCGRDGRGRWMNRLDFTSLVTLLARGCFIEYEKRVHLGSVLQASAVASELRFCGIFTRSARYQSVSVV